MAHRGETIRVQGYREFLLAVSLMPKEIRKDMRDALREAGEAVRKDSQRETSDRLSSPKSGAGYRTVVRTRGVSVQQSLRKTTGLRGDWGVTQMRKSLIPSLEENAPETEKLMEKAMEQVADFYELQARWRGLGFIE